MAHWFAIYVFIVRDFRKLKPTEAAAGCESANVAFSANPLALSADAQNPPSGVLMQSSRPIRQESATLLQLNTYILSRHNPQKTIYLYRPKLNFFLNQIAILIGLLYNPEKDGPRLKRPIRAPKMRHVRWDCYVFFRQNLKLVVFNTNMQLFRRRALSE